MDSLWWPVSASAQGEREIDWGRGLSSCVFNGFRVSGRHSLGFFEERIIISHFLCKRGECQIKEEMKVYIPSLWVLDLSYNHDHTILGERGKREREQVGSLFFPLFESQQSWNFFYQKLSLGSEMMKANEG